MLKPEQAKARLEQWILPEGKGRLLADVGRLSADLKELALDAFDLRPPLRRHDPGWSEQWKTTFLAAERLDQLPADDRRTVFSAISQHLAPAVEQTWQRLKCVPYQTGYNRRAFRAPNHPRLTLQRRIHWLHAIVALADRFPADVLSPAWLAAWTPHITIRYSNYGQSVGLLLASVVEDKSPAGAEVFEILRASLNNQHEIGAPGRHIYNAFLLADRPDAWEILEKAMLASQRQEGLRQAILEAVDESHPTAFQRMTRVILEHDLVRFSAVVRAFDVWLGHNWSAASAGIVKKMLARLVEFWDDAAARTAALRGKDGTDAFLALWCDALDDAPATVPKAAQLLAHKSIDMRYAAIHHLGNLQIPDAGFALAAALDDENIAVSILAVVHGYHYFASDWSKRHTRIDASQAADADADDRFERLERLLGRTTKSPKKVVSPLWPWIEFKFDRDHIGRLLVTTRGNRPMSRLVPHLTSLGPSFRQVAAGAIVAAEPWDAEIRHVIVDLAGDSATQVRATALESLKRISLTEPEAIRLESYLTRKTSDLRQKVLTLLIKQADEPALASARRMTAANDANQRLAGLEMLRVLHDAGRRPIECREIAAGFRRDRKKFSKDEELHLNELEKERQASHSLGDALGLIDPASRSPAVAPLARDVPFITPAAIACLKALDDLVHEHRETSLAIKLHHGEERQELLGNIRFGFPRPDREKPAPGQESELPLADIWRQWHRQRGPECRDADGLELVRASAWLLAFQRWRVDPWDESATQFPERVAMVAKLLGGMRPPKLRYGIIDDLLNWLLFLFPVDAREYLLDATESSYALVPAAAMKRLTEVKPPERPGYGWMAQPDHDWRNATVFQLWSNELARHIQLEGRNLGACERMGTGSEPTSENVGKSGCREVPVPILSHPLSNEQMQRWWQLMHWLEEPFPGAPRKRVEQSVLLWAYAHGRATLADVGDHLLGPRAQGGYRDESFDLVGSVTDRNWQSENASLLTERPELREFFERAVARILDLELARGDAPTLATRPALAITNLFGFATLHRILKTLGRADFKLASWHGEARLERRATLTHLAKHCYPAADESPELLATHFAAAIEAGDFSEERLLQLCFLAPQWAKAIEAFYGWDGLCEGIYWFLAHMKYAFGLGDQIGFDEAAEQADPSATPAGNATDAAPNGANEPAAPAPKKLSAWERLLRERTALTDAERGEGAVDIEWFHRTYAVLGKKHWDRLAAAARFAATPAQAKHARFIGDVLLGRVKRSVLTTGIEKKQLKDHVRMLGLLPLAKGKGREADLMLRAKVLREYRRYANQLSGLTKPDALRSWEIGMKNLAQAAGFADPLRLEWAVGAEAVKDLVKGPVSVSAGGIEVTLSLDHLAAPEVAVQKAGKPLKSIPPGAKKDKKIAALTGRVADIKRQASGIRQSLEAAMCRGDTFSGTELRSWFEHALLAPLLKRLVVVGEGVLGYPDKGGKTLRDHGGKLEPVKPGESLRIAHPFDLLQTREWHLWQRDCFTAERIQPFKQVFRELYVPNKQEKSATVSQRYDGQQIQPKQALALFNSRGWDTRDGIAKVYHHAAVSAIVGFHRGVTTPAEVEDPCLAGIVFMRHGERQLLKTADVPPRIFSETMRDLDLVVSVAHAGGVDPEASASTVEMRTGLLRETCSLLRLKNVRLNASHAVIDGELAQYSVHLGSGSVHKMPGGALCIVPVHAQQRGRIFLPFADDDPRTAEIVSKVLLLARDREIQDPVILEQIRR